MKRTLILTLIALFAINTFAQAQKRHTRAKMKPATAKTAEAQPDGTQPAPPYQNGQVVAITICKGLPIPEGYMIAGETSDNNCPHGWETEQTWYPPAPAPHLRQGWPAGGAGLDKRVDEAVR
jgi:hypothetical protein